jgi:hypothetical protein
VTRDTKNEQGKIMEIFSISLDIRMPRCHNVDMMREEKEMTKSTEKRMKELCKEEGITIARSDMRDAPAHRRANILDVVARAIQNPMEIIAHGDGYGCAYRGAWGGSKKTWVDYAAVVLDRRLYLLVWTDRTGYRGTTDVAKCHGRSTREVRRAVRHYICTHIAAQVDISSETGDMWF